jgi:NAD(P)-dependent dehydrogenase (short-subunit alcohol dehydrogenase family)
MPDQILIITGASRGLGAATARIAAELGAGVALNARSESDLEAVAADIQAAGGEALAVAGDLSQPEVCQRLVEQTIDHFGALNGLVNNAGIIEPIAPVADWMPEAWERNLAINVLGPVMLTQTALPHLRPRAGRVINISSGAAVRPIPGWSAYCAAKAALNMFNRSLAVEEDAITAIAFRPGVIDTDMQVAIRELGATGMPPDEHARFLRFHQDGDLRPPEVVGRTLAILAHG